MRSHSLAVLWLSAQHCADAFRLFDYYDPKSIEESYMISSRCRTALNTSVSCDVHQMGNLADGVDMNYWSMTNLTKLCTNDCSVSLVMWTSEVQKQCAGQLLLVEDIVMLPEALPYKFTTDYEMACLRDSKREKWCFYESQDWEGSDYIRYDEEMCNEDDILAEIPSKCNDPRFSVMDIDEDMKDITALYDKSLYCSECFLLVWRQRLQAIDLPPSEHTDYLNRQFKKLQASCSTSMKINSFTSKLVLQGRPTAAPTTTAAPPTITGKECRGQLVQPQKPAPQKPPLSCDDLSNKYNVTTGDLRLLTQDENCEFNKPLCLPPACELDVLVDTPNCDDLVRKYSSPSNIITRSIFITWNQNLLGDCDFLDYGQSVCRGPPGGFPKKGPVVSAPAPLGVYTASASPPTPTQPGTADSCGRYHKVVAGDTCEKVARSYQMTQAQLRKLNPMLNAGCTNMWENYSICIAKVTSGSTSRFISAMLSKDGRCGPEYEWSTCIGSGFGDCCSISGWCGSSEGHCGVGSCFLGDCAPDTGGRSATGECGPLFAGNKTCTGTKFGTCCSNYGECGNSDAHCGRGSCYSGACV